MSRAARHLVGWAVIIGSGVLVITARSPTDGLMGFICIAIGCALLVDD